jgi:hypothetical protein
LIQKTPQTTLRGRYDGQLDLIHKGVKEKVIQNPSFAAVVALLGLHFVLAFLMKQSSVFTTLHAYVTLAVSLFLLLRVKNQPEQLVYALSYIAGVELLWRGNNASTFYEIGKYSLIVLSTLGFFLQQRRTSFRKWPLLYLVLLVPSFFVLPYFDRQYIAFNLAGPVALAVTSLFLGTIHLSLPQFKHVLLAVLIPSVSLGFLSLFYTTTTESIDFTGASLKATAAGIGPNQVSSILGLAMVCAYAYALIETRNKPLRMLMVGIALWMLAQSMLTFSRGGLWTALGAVAVSAIFLLRNSQTRTRVLVASAFLIPTFVYIIFPVIDNFTGNTLSVRLQDPNTTNRDVIMQVDWKLFQDNPIFGVGPGQSEILHAVYFKATDTHTEYTRLLAEHGSFGVGVLLILAILTLQRTFGKRPIYAKSFGIMFTVWALLFMAHSATRLVAVSLVFAFPEMILDIDEDAKPEVIRERPSIHNQSPARWKRL